jgi:RNA polymerase sigma factor (sigma-70 family)
MCRTEWPRLVGALSLYTGDPNTAEDVAQEAFVRLCRDWERIQRHGNPTAWLFRVGFNVANSHYRRRGVERRWRDAQLPRPGIGTTSDGSDAVTVRAVLLTLPIDERAVLVLRFYGQLTLREVAAALGIPEGTAKTRSRRALERLRTAGLIDEDEEQGADV